MAAPAIPYPRAAKPGLDGFRVTPWVHHCGRFVARHPRLGSGLRADAGTVALAVRAAALMGPRLPAVMAGLPACAASGASPRPTIGYRQPEVSNAVGRSYLPDEPRSEERRVGKACVSPCRSRW